MDIAAMSVLLNQGKVQQQVGLSVMKMAMDVATNQGEQIAALVGESVKTMERSVQPFLGASIDIQA